MAPQKRLTPDMVGEGPKVVATIDPIRVRLGDLTGRQVLAIERAAGVPMSEWDKRSSDVLLAAGIRSAIEGAPVDAYVDGFPALALVASVEVDSDDDDADDDPGND